MKRAGLLFFMSLFFLSCAQYYHGTDGLKYVYRGSDTLLLTWYVRSDTAQYVYTEQVYRNGDTLYTAQYMFDSTYNSYVDYVYTPESLRMLRYYNIVSLTMMFYEVKRDLSFSFSPRHVGKVREKVRFTWPEQGVSIMGVNKSVGSALDTVVLGDSLARVLRVDVRYRYINRHRPDKKKNVLKGRVSYFYYPGLGPIFVKEPSKDYEARVINVQKF